MENGKMDVMGINIDISQVLGRKIVDQYMAQLDEEQMKSLMDYISSDLFKTTSYYDWEKKEQVSKMVIKERTKDSWGRWNETEVPIGELVKKQFNERISEELKKKVEEIVASADYQEKIEQIANELVDYSVNGYKEDMKNRIRERLVGNVMDASPYYGGISLQYLINEAIDRRLSN